MPQEQLQSCSIITIIDVIFKNIMSPMLRNVYMVILIILYFVLIFLFSRYLNFCFDIFYHLENDLIRKIRLI